MPGQIEDVFDDDRATGDDGDLQADQRDDRDEGVLHGVGQHHSALLKALGPGHPHIVLTQDFQHHGAGHAHGAGRQVGSQDQGGKDEYGEVGQRVDAEGDVHDLGRPTPPDSRVDDDQQRELEVRCRQADDCH